MTDLTSAVVPAVGVRDHVAGEGEGIILYIDFGCPRCAAMWAQVRQMPLAVCFRHFPMPSKHPRSAALHAAAEAAGLQGHFWEMADSLFAERGRVDDPHLWERTERLGMDLERFNADRRSEAVRSRIRADFESGVRAGVIGTPVAFTGGELVSEKVQEHLQALSSS